VTRLIIFLALALALAANHAAAQAWPSKTVRFIVASSPGGVPDIAARILADRFSRAFNGSFVVENMMGGGGLLGAQTTSRAAPDGHTIWMATSTHLTSNPYMFKSLPYDPVRDYDPVALLISSGFVFAVNAELPVRNIEDLVSLAKSRSGKLNYASTSPRGAAGIVGEWFNHIAGTRIVQIPYKTTAQAAQDTAGGVTQLIIISLGVVAPFVQAGKIRVIGVNASRRHPDLPDVRLVSETYPGFALDSWLALVVPRGTPRDIVLKLNRSANEFMREPRTGKGDTYFTVGSGSPEEVGEFIRKDRDLWGQITKTLKIEPE
jgi:tripartite-type tricarboxylate transporter receptor subunit TctC